MLSHLNNQPPPTQIAHPTTMVRDLKLKQPLLIHHHSLAALNDYQTLLIQRKKLGDTQMLQKQSHMLTKRFKWVYNRPSKGPLEK